MSDLPKIDLEGDSEPLVALALLRIIMECSGEKTEHDRDWILSTYADCLAVVGGAEVSYEDDEDEEEEEGKPEED
ncbi:hypothetical protein [Roseomonas xinghualingensis]|uniref:hypothetical protein n=1 Tax=Roseomonas xinghualingensis TaxID=2986475 RepID=UPI0021F0D04E|nr:hypothetical protein [Roseomonas sp. SXEYE001]